MDEIEEELHEVAIPAHPEWIVDGATDDEVREAICGTIVLLQGKLQNYLKTYLNDADLKEIEKAAELVESMRYTYSALTGQYH